METKGIGPNITAASHRLAATMNFSRIAKDRSHLAPLTPTVRV